jgi:hypothetical protein
MKDETNKENQEEEPRDFEEAKEESKKQPGKAKKIAKPIDTKTLQVAKLACSITADEDFFAAPVENRKSKLSESTFQKS